MKFRISIEDEREGAGKTVTSTFETDYWPDALDTLLGLLQTQSYVIPKNLVYLNTNLICKPEFAQFFSTKQIKDED